MGNTSQRLVLLFLLFLYSFFTFAQKDEKLENVSLISNVKISKSSNYLLQKILARKKEWNRYESKKKAIYLFNSDQLIVSSNDVILIGKEIEYRKLFFTGLYYDLTGRLKEARYFFYGNYDKLRLEYFSQREKIKSEIGIPNTTNSGSGEVETIWYKGDQKISFKFGKERVSNEGAIFLSIVKLSKEKQLLLATNKTSTQNQTSSKALPLISKNINKQQKEKTLHSNSLGNRNKKQLFSVSKPTSLRSEGIDGAPIISRIRMTDTILINDNNSNHYWTKVRLRNLDGWVKTALIKRIEK